MAIAAYVRVSTRQQSVEAQREAISRAAAARGDVIDHWFQEKISGSTLERPELNELRVAARAGRISKVYVFRVDRLSRGGIRDTLAIVEELRAHGCRVASVSDGFSLDGPAGDVVLAVMAWAAQMERAALGERISAARERVEASGGHWGRRRRAGAGKVEHVRQLRDAGLTVREISKATKIPRSTVSAVLSGKGPYGEAAETPAK